MRRLETFSTIALSKIFTRQASLAVENTKHYDLTNTIKQHAIISKIRNQAWSSFPSAKNVLINQGRISSTIRITKRIPVASIQGPAW